MWARRKNFWSIPNNKNILNLASSLKKIRRKALDIEKAKINLETAKIQWDELQRFFAAGKVLYVDSSQDLVEVARLMSVDQVNDIQTLVEEGKLTAVTDEQALSWHDSQALVWSVVVSPYVLVQQTEE